MATRFNLSIAGFCVALGLGSLAIAAAGAGTAEIPPQVENAKFQFAGMINANAVNIRSGPSENYYPCMKAERGARVTVVGIKFDWLKIVPLEGCYSVIAKNLVDREGQSHQGTVNTENSRVRAGSSLVVVKTTVQCLLKKGTAVAILGEEEAYYQIKPPAEAYVYVHQKFVDPVKQLNTNPIAGSQQQNDGSGTAREGPSTQPVAQEKPGHSEEPQLAKVEEEERKAAKAEAEFDRLEAALRESLEKPLEQQPLSDLIAGYERLVKNSALSISMQQISKVRLIGLRAKAQSQQELLTMRKQEEESAQKINALEEDRRRIEEKMSGGMAIYTALGTLQASTLQFGKGTLYRITDPATGRTLCYVRSEDPKLARNFLEKFVGVRGEVGTDPQVSLQIVSAKEIAAVDPAVVNKKATAQISPPSLLSKPTAAATTNNE